MDVVATVDEDERVKMQTEGEVIDHEFGVATARLKAGPGGHKSTGERGGI